MRRRTITNSSTTHKSLSCLFLICPYLVELLGDLLAVVSLFEVVLLFWSFYLVF